MDFRRSTFCAIVFYVMSGCSSDNNPAATDNTVQNPSFDEASSTINIDGSYKVDPGYSLPLNADLAISWTVSSGTPDYVYISQGLFMDDTGFTLPLPETLQDLAINSYGVAVGIVSAFSQGAGPAAGVLEDFGEDGLLGWSEHHAIIYKSADAIEGLIDWVDDFPSGYSCGRIERTAEGEGFDSFIPVSCNELSVRIGDYTTFERMNWT